MQIMEDRIRERAAAAFEQREGYKPTESELDAYVRSEGYNDLRARYAA